MHTFVVSIYTYLILVVAFHSYSFILSLLCRRISLAQTNKYHIVNIVALKVFRIKILHNGKKTSKNTKTPKLTSNGEPAFWTKNKTKASRLNELILTHQILIRNYVYGNYIIMVMLFRVSSTTTTTKTNFIIVYERDNEWKSHKCGINI